MSPSTKRMTSASIYGNEVAVDSTGSKNQYTVPTGKEARLHAIFNSGDGDETGQSQISDGSAQIPISNQGAGVLYDEGNNRFGQLPLNSGDTAEFNVTSAGSCGSTTDLATMVEETA